MTKRVLVVEDNELNLKLFCDLLRAHGHEAEPVRDARDALERAQLTRPDLIVMDIQMPHISGLELIEAVRRDVVLRPMLIATSSVVGLCAPSQPKPEDVANNHLAYAVQWFLFAAAAAIIYLLALRKRQAG